MKNRRKIKKSTIVIDIIYTVSHKHIIYYDYINDWNHVDQRVGGVCLFKI